MKNIHIVIGSKGGIGKTRCSTSLSLYYLNNEEYNQDNKRIALFDANVNNIDFFTLLAGVKAANHPIKATESFKIANCRSEKKMHIEYYSFLKKDEFRLYNGAPDFWIKIKKVVEACRRKSRKDGHDIENLIVDTNLAFLNLISYNQKEEDSIARTFSLLKELGVRNVIIWYVWCLNDFLNSKKNNAIISDKGLRKLSNLSNNLFNSKKNAIHVLNPYLFIEDDRNSIFETFIRGVSKFIKILPSKPLKNDEEMNFCTLAELAKNITDIILKIIEKVTEKSSETNLLGSDAIKKLTKLLDELNSMHANVLVLEYDRYGKNFIRDMLIMRSDHPPQKKQDHYIVDLEVLNQNDFGVNTIWRKIDKYLKLVLND